MKPITEQFSTQMWELACLHGVGRDDLRPTLGLPHFTESDSSRTFGGEEDWWRFELDSGHQVALCLRVPYSDAILLADTRDPAIPLTAFAAAVRLGKVDVYDRPFPPSNTPNTSNRCRLGGKFTFGKLILPGINL